MKDRYIFIASIVGIGLALASAYILGVEPKPQPPVFNPAPNPYPSGIYANGIVESAQSNGQNINIYPEVAGTVMRILVNEGDKVAAGTPMLLLDDSVQRATVSQQKSQAEAAQTVLQQLRAQPRKENLAVAKAQLDLAEASLKTSEDQYNKQKRSYELDPRSVSKEAFDNARNAQNAALANLEVARRQYELTRAGAWIYDINNQERLADALMKAYQASNALLQKYTIRAPVDGMVLSMNTAVGSYVSPQGVYGSYIQAYMPVMTMGGPQDFLNVRCYIDEVLINRLPPADQMTAQMFVRGTDIRVPLEFVRIQPFVSPKISLSDQRQERVDLRVLPIVFRFAKSDSVMVYPGQLVDVYVGKK